MTRATAIASILKKLGDAHYQAADELLALASTDEPAAGTAGVRPAAADSLPAAPARPPQESDFAEGSDSVCPKHHRAFQAGQYGPFCSAKSDDPAWSNKRGYCSITPKNVAQYLRVQAAA